MSASGDPRRISMTVTFLEMTAKPAALPPPLPRGKIAFLRSEHPPVHFYRYLYDTVGGKYFWVDRIFVCRISSRACSTSAPLSTI